MTSPTDVLQAALDGLPAQCSRRDLQARRALRAALDALRAGRSPQHALEAVAVSLEDAHHSRRTQQDLPQKGQG